MFNLNHDLNSDGDTSGLSKIVGTAGSAGLDITSPENITNTPKTWQEKYISLKSDIETHYTDTQIAKEVGISLSSINQWKAKTKNLDVLILNRLKEQFATIGSASLKALQRSLKVSNPNPKNIQMGLELNDLYVTTQLNKFDDPVKAREHIRTLIGNILGKDKDL